MKACILAVGTELLFGQINNTNATFLSQELNNLGIDVLYHRTVGDNSHRLERQIKDIFKECDLILVTGGLGPTQDDLTKETISKVFNRELILDEEEFKHLKEIFKKRNSQMAESNVKQVMMPKNSIVLHNDNGTAPGFILEEERKNIIGEEVNNMSDSYLDEICTIISMPGPPREMKPMFKESVEAYLRKRSNFATCYKFIRTIGIGESDLEKLISDFLLDQREVTIAPYASLGEVYLRITSKSTTFQEAEKLVDKKVEALMNVIGKYVYSLENYSLDKVVLNMLIDKNLSISSAESCTGGMFAQKLTSNSGASKVFNRGFITYSNEAKVDNLGVKQVILDTYGAVSKETAEAMAEGVKKLSNADIGISVTGIAGPNSDNTNKEIGLVFIGISYNKKVKSFKFNFTGNRDDIRNRSVLMMFYLLYEILQEAE